MPNDLHEHTWQCSKCLTKIYACIIKPTYLEHPDCDGIVLRKVMES